MTTPLFATPRSLGDAPTTAWSALAFLVVFAAPACGGNEKRPSPDTSADVVSDTTEDVTEDTTSPDGTPDADTTPLTGVNVGVGNALARSCELVVRDPDQVVGAVTFDDSVEGRSVDEGLKVAIAFFRKADAAIDDGAVSLGIIGGDGAAGGLALEKITCFDRSGATLADPGVSILR